MDFIVVIEVQAMLIFATTGILIFVRNPRYWQSSALFLWLAWICYKMAIYHITQ